MGGFAKGPDVYDKRAELLAFIEGFLGVFYKWGGDYDRWLKKLDYGLDCSGFEQAIARHQGIDQPGDQTADGIRQFYLRAGGQIVRLGEEDLGDRVFYGKNHATHVALVVAKGQIIGANGGGSATTTLNVAKAQGAKIRRDRLQYRNDLFCIVRPKLPKG